VRTAAWLLAGLLVTACGGGSIPGSVGVPGLTAVTTGRNEGGPTGLTVGPDGALWFVSFADVVGRLTTAGSLTAYPIPTLGSNPCSIVLGPDGALWFTELIGNIGRAPGAGGDAFHLRRSRRSGRGTGTRP
jgi:virginiamycin B lyase